MKEIIHMRGSDDWNLVCFRVANHELVSYARQRYSLVLNNLPKRWLRGYPIKQSGSLSPLIFSRLDGFQPLPRIPQLF